MTSKERKLCKLFTAVTNKSIWIKGYIIESVLMKWNQSFGLYNSSKPCSWLGCWGTPLIVHYNLLQRNIFNHNQHLLVFTCTVSLRITMLCTSCEGMTMYIFDCKKKKKTSSLAYSSLGHCFKWHCGFMVSICRYTRLEEETHLTKAFKRNTRTTIKSFA